MFTKRILVFSTAFVAVMAGTAVAQDKKETPPPPGAVRPFHFPKYETKKLSNGLTVYAIEDHRVPVISYRLEVTTAGASANEAKKAGLAYLTAELLNQATQTRSAQQIASIVDRVGATLNTGATIDGASIGATSTKSASPVVLEVMADVTLRPTFPQAEMDRLLKQTLSGLQINYKDPQALARYLTPRVAYGNHPYSLPVEGTPDTLRALKREDIANFYATHYGPSVSYLAIAGNITPAEAFAAAEKHFGSWKAETTPLKISRAAASGSRQIIIIDKPDAVQTQFGLVQVSIPRNDPDYIPLAIANQIFGGSFNSRLNMKLRAAEGLTYGANSNFSALVRSGTFNVGSFSRTEKTSTAIKMMTDLAGDLLKSPITDAELNEARAFLAGSFALSIETPGQVAGRVLSAAVNGLPANYWDTYREAIQATTRDQVVAAVKKNLTPDKMNIVAVGNASGFAKELEQYGTVRVIPLNDLDLTTENLLRVKQTEPTGTDVKPPTK